MDDRHERFLIGYARVSTEEQDLRMQINALVGYGIPEDHIVKEKVSGKSLSNRKLRKILAGLRPGDRIVVWKLDRLGRSLKDLVFIVEEIERKGADLVSLTEGVDTTTAIGRLFYHIMAALAEFERSLTSERTKAGMLAKKLSDPGYKPGPKHKITGVPARIAQVQALVDAGELEIVPKYKQRGPEKGERIGYTLKGRGKLEPLRDALNACVEGEPEIGNTQTIVRWLEDGAPGLKLNDDSNSEGSL